MDPTDHSAQLAHFAKKNSQNEQMYILQMLYLLVTSTFQIRNFSRPVLIITIYYTTE